VLSAHFLQFLESSILLGIAETLQELKLLNARRQIHKVAVLGYASQPSPNEAPTTDFVRQSNADRGA